IVVGRLSLDMLRARRSRREEYPGTWLPEPVVSTVLDNDPEHEAVLADSVGLALLVVLDTLTPAERLAFVLHDVFAVSFDEIAPLVDRSPAAARQLASRAREGDFEGLLRILDPDVVLRTDGGPNAPRPFARPPLVGAEAVARAAMGFRDGAGRVEPAIVNGAAGLIVRFPALSIVGAFTVA